MRSPRSSQWCARKTRRVASGSKPSEFATMTRAAACSIECLGWRVPSQAPARASAARRPSSWRESGSGPVSTSAFEVMPHRGQSPDTEGPALGPHS
jgi:hypothetical protein